MTELQLLKQQLQNRGLFLGLFIGLVLAAFAGTIFYELNGTYEECLVTEMRGQPYTMIGNVHLLCAQRFGKEVTIDPTEVEISFSSDSHVSPKFSGISTSIPTSYEIVAKSSPTNVQLTRASFRLFAKDCSQATRDDEVTYETLEFMPYENGFTFFHSGAPLRCAQIDQIFGIYRPWWRKLL